MKCPNCKGRGYRLSTSWVPYKSTTAVNCGLCNGAGHLQPRELSPDCPVSTPVYWRQLNGMLISGILKEWDNGTAFVMVMGKVRAVRVN